MQAEFDALQKNITWILVPREKARKIFGNKWVFRVKYNPDGSISKYKARLVAKGFHQTQEVDFFETFSPILHNKNYSESCCHESLANSTAGH